MKAQTVTVVLGLGNPVRGDDAVGLHVAARVEHLLAARPVAGVRVVTSTRGGFELIDLLAGADRAIVVDCLDVPGGRAGRVRRLRVEDVAGCARLVGSHDIGLGTALELGRRLGVAMPSRVHVVGIEAAETSVFEERLSPEVAAAVDRVAADVYSTLLDN